MKIKYFYEVSLFSLLPEEHLHRCLHLLLQWDPHREKCEVSAVLCGPAANTQSGTATAQLSRQQGAASQF